MSLADAPGTREALEAAAARDAVGRAEPGSGVPRWAVAGLAALVVVAFGRVVGNEFTTWDDAETIYRNPMFNPPDWRMILETWDPSKPRGSLWVPVTYTVWGALAELGKLNTPDPSGVRLNPAVFHGASLITHLVSTLLVFVLLRRLVRNPDGAPSGRWTLADRWAFVGAAVFGVHPLQAEAVGWTSGLKDLLCGMFTLGAVYCYVRSVSAGAVRPLLWGSRWWWAGLMLFVLGTLSKPTAMVTPALALTVHWIAMRRPWREAVRGLWPWFAFVPVVAWWTKTMQSAVGVPIVPLWQRPLVAADAVVFYVYKLVWPASLGFHYGRTPRFIVEEGYVWWTWVGAVAVGAGLVLARRRWPGVTAGGLWFLVGVSPVLGFTPFLFQYYTTVADHYMYLSMAGVGLAVATGLTWAEGRGWGRGRWARVAGGAVAVVVAAMVVRSAVQIGTWKDSATLYRHGLGVNPRSFAAEVNLAVLTLNDPLKTRESLLEAMARLDRAVAARPEYSGSYDNRAVAKLFLGQREEAVADIERALEAGRRMPVQLREHVAESYLMLGQYQLERMDRPGLAAESLELGLAEVRKDDPGTRRQIEALLGRARALAATRPAEPPRVPPTLGR